MTKIYLFMGIPMLVLLFFAISVNAQVEFKPYPKPDTVKKKAIIKTPEKKDDRNRKAKLENVYWIDKEFTCSFAKEFPRKPKK